MTGSGRPAARSGRQRPAEDRAAPLFDARREFLIDQNCLWAAGGVVWFRIYTVETISSPGARSKVATVTTLARERARTKALCARCEELQAENARVRAEIAQVLLQNIQLRRDLRITRQTSPTSNVAVLPVLTERELEVVRRIVQGRSTKQVASDLGISFKTAVTHRSNAMRKLRVHETASLVRIAIREGLVNIA